MSFFFPETRKKKHIKVDRKYWNKVQWNYSYSNPFICLPGVMGRAPEFDLLPLYTTCCLLPNIQMSSSYISSCMDCLPLFLLLIDFPVQIREISLSTPRCYTTFSRDRISNGFSERDIPWSPKISW